MISISQFHFNSLDSTQDKAFELIESGKSLPFYVTADELAKLRGRRGRSWEYEKGNSLAFSLAIQIATHKLPGLSLVVGLALANYLRHLPIQLKWPNDLMWLDKKVGGILIESRIQSSQAQVVIGIGANCFDLKNSNYRGIGRKLEAAKIAAAVLEQINLLEQKDLSFFKPEYEKKMWKINETVEMEIDGRYQSLILRGISEQGELLIENGGKLQLNSTGEICHAE